MFQSTHPRRVRPTTFSQRTALTRCFNPRTHVGCDTKTFRRRFASSLFQSTHPRRVRLLCVLIEYKSTCFNPRTHVGCDHLVERCTQFNRCFNPRTHVGCDRLLAERAPIKRGFNPRTHVGCDSQPAAASRVRSVSIHAPT